MKDQVVGPNQNRNSKFVLLLSRHPCAFQFLSSEFKICHTWQVDEQLNICWASVFSLRWACNLAALDLSVNVVVQSPQNLL